MFGIENVEPFVALIMLALLFVAFIYERYPPDVTAAIGAAAFILVGFVPSRDVMAVFSNAAPITIAAMFVISGALVRTGLLDAVADAIVLRSRTRPVGALVLFFLVVVVMSAFVNNTPLVLILIPVVIRLSGAIGVAPTRLLIPLSYAAILGGTCTLIGTSTNLLVDGVAREAGMTAFSIFEITKVGLVAATTGMVLLLVLGPLLLPSRKSAEITESEPTFLTEVTLLDGAPQIGQSLGEVAEFTRPGIRVTGLRRSGKVTRTNLPETILQKGDALIVVTTASEVLTLHEEDGFVVGHRRAVPARDASPPIVAEAIVAPSRGIVGEPLAALGLGRRFGLQVLGVHRHRHIAGADLPSVRLRPADRLMLQGSAEGFDALAETGDLVSISRPSGRAYRRRQAPVALLGLVAVVALAAFDVMDIGLLAMLAVAGMLLLRCIDNDEAWGSIDASILILIFAMLIVGTGLQNTGAVELMVSALVPLLGGLPPIVLLIAVYATASILTELVTNNAVAVILTPIVIGLAAQTGLEARPLVVAVMFGASASFATPIGYQTNTLVYGAGNYRFTDFLRVGVPMNIVAGAAAIIAISLFFPLTGTP